jgi:hypothetical protein
MRSTVHLQCQEGGKQRANERDQVAEDRNGFGDNEGDGAIGEYTSSTASKQSLS